MKKIILFYVASRRVGVWFISKKRQKIKIKDSSDDGFVQSICQNKGINKELIKIKKKKSGNRSEEIFQ